MAKNRLRKIRKKTFNQLLPEKPPSFGKYIVKAKFFYNVILAMKDENRK